MTAAHWPMPRSMASYSVPEAAMLAAIHAAGLQQPVSEYQFARPRKWRLDFCWPDRKLAVECEGGTWTEGRHVRGAGFLEDARKYNSAALGGWLVLRFTSEQIASGEAIGVVERGMRARPAPAPPAPKRRERNARAAG